MTKYAIAAAICLLCSLSGCGQSSGVVSTEEEYKKYAPPPEIVDAMEKGLKDQAFAAQQAAEMRAAAIEGAAN